MPERDPLYVPAHYAVDHATAADFVAAGRAADFVTPTATGVVSSFLPYVFDRENNRLLAHFSRGNDHWQATPNGESLAIVHGPDAYISARWYPSTRDSGGSGPTWNYTLAHIRGELVIHDDPAWSIELIRRLIDANETDLSADWSLDDVSDEYLHARIRGVVGVELRIRTLQAKFKLSQNRPPEDVPSVIAGLRAHAGRVVSEEMERLHSDAPSPTRPAPRPQ